MIFNVYNFQGILGAKKHLKNQGKRRSLSFCQVLAYVVDALRGVLGPVHTGSDPYGHHIINLKSLKTCMTLKFVIILQNLIKVYHRKSGKSKYDRKLTELDVETTRIQSHVNGVLGRGLLSQKVARNPFSLHPSGEHLLCGLFVRHIGTLLPKKVPKQKTCPIPRKRVICDYLLLNYITGKKYKISCSTITKTSSIIKKSTKNCNFGSTFTHKTKITRKLFEE